MYTVASFSVLSYSMLTTIPLCWLLLILGWQNLRPEIPRCCPTALASVMRKCWDVSPDKRPEMEEVVKQLYAIDTSKGGGMIPEDQATGCFCFGKRRGPWNFSSFHVICSLMNVQCKLRENINQLPVQSLNNQITSLNNAQTAFLKPILLFVFSFPLILASPLHVPKSGALDIFNVFNLEFKFLLHFCLMLCCKLQPKEKVLQYFCYYSVCVYIYIYFNSS